MPPARRILRTDRPATALAVAAVAAGTALAYANSLGIPFLLDDLVSVQQNPSLRPPWSWRVLDPGNTSTLGGRPLANLSFALNYAAHGLGVAGYHLVNLALHGAAALTLFAIVRRTLARSRPGGPGATPDMTWPSALLALAWAAHPVLTHAVSYVSQRTELLAGLCTLLALYAFLRALAAGRPGRWFVASAAACYAGVAAKEVAATAPLLLLLYDRTFVSGTFAAALRARGRFYAALAGSWVLLAMLVRGLAERGAGFGSGPGALEYLFTSSRTLLLYLKLTLWPHPLVFDHGADFLRHARDAAPFLAASGALIAATLVALRRAPRAGFLAAAFLLLLAPTTSFIPVALQPVAENRLYLPLVASTTAVGLVAWRLLGRGALPLALVVLAGEITLTHQRNALLQSPLGLWEETVALRPANARAHASLGLAHLDAGDAPAAIPHFERSLTLDPASAATEQNLGTALATLRQFAAAQGHLRRAVELNPRFAPAHNNLGAVLAELGDHEGAIEAYRTALRLDPDHAGAHENLARVQFAAGQFADAVVHYGHVLRLTPSADAHYNLGLALARAGKLTEAKPHLARALQLRPSASGYVAYGHFLADAGDQAGADAAFTAALALDPASSAARAALERLRP